MNKLKVRSPRVQTIQGFLNYPPVFPAIPRSPRSARDRHGCVECVALLDVDFVEGSNGDGQPADIPVVQDRQTSPKRGKFMRNSRLKTNKIGEEF